MKMIKKFGSLAVLLALVCSLLAGSLPVTVLAAGEINIVSSTAVADFPDFLLFELEAFSGSKITDARLHFTVERDSFVKVVSEQKLDFTPSSNITAEYTWDMRYSGGLPTGTTVNYWWTIIDNAGVSLTTEEQQAVFADTRFEWEKIQSGNLSLYWYSGNAALAQTLMDTALQGLDDLEDSTGARLSRPVAIYIYANSSDMKGGMLFAQDWTGGATYPYYSTIVLGINAANLEWGKRAMVHELAHMVNYQMTSNPYSDLPVWLDEGLAMYAEGPLEDTFEITLIAALAQDSLFTVRSMASPFSTDANLSYLEYAQSYSVVDFLISEYGRDKMTELLEAYHLGDTYDGALMQVYGFDMDGLYILWRPFAAAKYLAVQTGASL
jgi:hypothetical protein